MGIFSTEARNNILDAIFNQTAYSIATPHAALHDGHPGLVGSNEITGGTYARQVVTTSFAAASAGTVASNADIEWLLLPAVGPAPAGIFFVGIWTSLAGATAAEFAAFAPLSAARNLATAADTGDVFTADAHGYANDDRVYLEAGLGAGLPAGATADTLYHVVGATANTFQLSATQGGAAITLTSDGQALATKVVPKTTNLNDTLSIASGSLTFGVQ